MVLVNLFDSDTFLDVRKADIKVFPIKNIKMPPVKIEPGTPYDLP